MEVLADGVVVGTALPYDASGNPGVDLQVRFSYSVGGDPYVLLKDARLVPFKVAQFRQSLLTIGGAWDVADRTNKMTEAFKLVGNFDARTVPQRIGAIISRGIGFLRAGGGGPGSLQVNAVSGTGTVLQASTTVAGPSLGNEEIARNASVAKPKPDPMIEVDAALGIKRANEAINEVHNERITVHNGAKHLPPVTPSFDRAAFFAVLRQGPLRHRKPTQVAGTEAILDAMHDLPVSWCAYALATAWHETAYTMQPIKERGGHNYFMRMYDMTGQRPHVARDLGNTQEGDGAKYAGRGYVQLTGRRNYARAQQKTGASLLQNPDLAMDHELAARIMRDGMVEGWFTGRGFVHFLPSKGPASSVQFRQARRIINGLDKADKIAGEALAFQAALIGGGWE